MVNGKCFVWGKFHVLHIIFVHWQKFHSDALILVLFTVLTFVTNVNVLQLSHDLQKLPPMEHFPLIASMHNSRCVCVYRYNYEFSNPVNFRYYSKQVDILISKN